MQNTRAVAKVGLVFCLLIAVSGCIGNYRYAKEMEDKDRSLVFGYVDMKDSKTYLDAVAFEKNVPGNKEEYLKARVVGQEDDVFYLENIKGGPYRFTYLFSVTGAIGHTFWLPESGPGAMHFKIGKPGIYFLGSYKVRLLNKDGFFGKQKFELIPVKSPTEKEILKTLLPYTKDTKWEGLAVKRLREL